MGDYGPTAKDSCLCHEEDQRVTALGNGVMFNISVSLQSLLFGYFVGLGKDASMFKMQNGLLEAENSAKSFYLCLCKPKTLLIS